LSAAWILIRLILRAHLRGGDVDALLDILKTHGAQQHVLFQRLAPLLLGDLAIRQHDIQLGFVAIEIIANDFTDARINGPGLKLNF
jgi:hypothetical protein